MPSRKSRSRSRSPSRRHKKSHKRSRRSSNESSPSPTPSTNSRKSEEKSNGSDSSGIYKPRLPSVMLPPSFLAKLEPKEETTPTQPVESASATTNVTSVTNTSSTNSQPTKKRKSRWIGDETEKVFLPNMPTTISTVGMTEQQQKIYLLQLQVEELSRRLKVNDLGIPARVEDRSPSPEPIYDQQGKRQNTREVRARRKIEEQRHQLVTELLTLNPEYKAPADYKPQQNKFIEKVMIPQEDHPEVNFVGLIIGPRGSTLKNLEKESGAKIIIRGKGSVKDGKMGLVKHGPLPGEDEPLHAYITGTTQEMVTSAAEKVQEIINKSIDAPEGLNELRKQQLRQLALLNGTLRENEPLIKMKLIEEAEKIVTNTIICSVCGGAGHISSDCKFRRNPDGTFVDPSVDGSYLINGNRQEQQKLDCEYQSLINELSGKKDTDSALTLADRRNLLSGTKMDGPTLAIASGLGSAPPSTTTDMNLTQSNTNSFTTTNKNNNPTPSMPSNNNQTNSSNYYSNQQSTAVSNYSSTSAFGNTGPRYNNSDVFDGYHLLRRHNRNNNYSNYIEGDSYRAQHIPALIESSSSTTTGYSYSQQQSYGSNQSWNGYNAAMYYQNAYRHQFYPNTSHGFVPPLPKGPPPPPPPPI